jgi:hypothetical protein
MAPTGPNWLSGAIESAAWRGSLRGQQKIVFDREGAIVPYCCPTAVLAADLYSRGSCNNLAPEREQQFGSETDPAKSLRMRARGIYNG